MVSRVYVEKKPGFDGEARALAAELRDIVGISGLTGVRLVNRYDVEGASEELFAACVPTVFSEPQSDTATYDLPDAPGAAVFAVEYLPGQFDQRADSASECIQLISQGERPDVRSAVVYYLEGNLTDADVEAVKRYVINPVEAREASLEPRDTLAMAFERPADVEVIEGFTAFSDDELARFIDERGLAMDLADIQFCRAYFAEEGRDPSITEIKMIDTYWSDHCRHTTFGTVLDDVEIADANVQAAFDRYLELRHELGRDEKPVCLMDMGTIGAKWLKKEGILTGLDESEEINACTIKCKVDVDGEEQDWLYLFKNETHNHPTEIEPFGGAATCVGGAIRDPLSGRSYVYQAMRVTGAADPTVPVADTIPGKLPQRKLVTTAAIPPTATRSAWPRARCTSCTTPATPPSAWKSARWWALRRPITCVARRRRRGMWWCFSAAARAATASAVPRALPRPIPWNLWKAAGPRCRRATRQWSARSSACSAAGMLAA